jgi:signal transduction histidine kinase
VRIPRPSLDGAYVTDGLVALLVLAVLYAPLVIPRANQPGPFSIWAWILLATTPLPLVWRRRFPTLCLLGVAASLFGYDAVNDGPNQPVAWGLLVAAYSVAWAGRRRQVVVLLLVCGTGLAMSKSLTTSTIGLLTTATAYVLGILARRREVHVRALAHRAGEMERGRELDLARAATAERARIARDIHDILAHAVSLMVVQAEAGPVVVRASPERAERAFDAIADAGRDAMVQIRRMLGVLKDEGEAGARAPQPSVAVLPALADQISATSGIAVDLRTDGEARALPADAEVAAYRIVQEALTNTVKHANATQVEVHLDWTPVALAITVVDDGRGALKHSGPGRGLIGIRERAAACGGAAEAGPEPGGYRVTASLPYARAEVPSS